MSANLILFTGQSWVITELTVASHIILLSKDLRVVVIGVIEPNRMVLKFNF